MLTEMSNFYRREANVGRGVSNICREAVKICRPTQGDEQSKIYMQIRWLIKWLLVKYAFIYPHRVLVSKHHFVVLFSDVFTVVASWAVSFLPVSSSTESMSR